MADEELEKIRQRKMKEVMDDLARKRMRNEEKASSPVPGTPLKVTDESFGDLVRSNPVVVVDFWATWCPPCRVLAPIIEQLARDYAGKILFGKLDVDGNQQTAAKFGVMSVPTLLLFKDGKLVDRIVGAMPRNLLEERITRHL